MTTRAQVALLIGANYPLAASALFNLGAYFSHDTSGIQYIMLDWSVWSAVLSGVLLGALRLWAYLHWVKLLLPVACFLVSALPQVTGLGYNGPVLDQPGALLAAALLVVEVVVVILGVRRLTSVRAA